MSAVPDINGSLEAALGQLRRGGLVVVCDDPDREKEGDLCLAAQFVTAEKIAFMAREGLSLGRMKKMAEEERRELEAAR